MTTNRKMISVSRKVQEDGFWWTTLGLLTKPEYPRVLIHFNAQKWGYHYYSNRNSKVDGFLEGKPVTITCIASFQPHL